MMVFRTVAAALTVASPPGSVRELVVLSAIVQFSTTDRSASTPAMPALVFPVMRQFLTVVKSL